MSIPCKFNFLTPHVSTNYQISSFLFKPISKLQKREFKYTMQFSLLPWPTSKSSCYIAPKKNDVEHWPTTMCISFSALALFCLNCNSLVILLYFNDSSNDHERALRVHISFNDINCWLHKRELISSHSPYSFLSIAGILISR